MVSLPSPSPEPPRALGSSEYSQEETKTDVDQRVFRDGYEPVEGDVFIAVLGVTGAGKVILSSIFTFSLRLLTF
jgi:hypothetical protein